MSQVLDGLYANYSGRASTPRQREVAKNQRGPVADEAVTPSGFGETFDRGFGAGIEGIRTDIDYLKGLYNTVTGDTDAAVINIQTAREREARIAESLSGLETFAEFVENPTLSGLMSQTAKIGGQVSPYALTTISSAGSGAAVSLFGKAALTASSKAVAKNIIKESIERTVKGEATPDEKDLAELSYRLAQRSLPGRAANQITASRGAIGGQLLEEYSLMAGANFGENLEVEGLSDMDAAYRALSVAAPQAVIGVAGERVIQNAIFNKLGRITEKRGASDSLMADLGKEIAKATGKGAASEAIAETAQESLQIANIMQADPTYQAQDAYMRLAESAFSGAIGGGGMAGAGRTAVGSLQAAGGVMAKAKQFIEDAREQQVTRQYNKEQYGVDESGYTTQEPLKDMAAQKRSFQDTTTARNSLWIAGGRPEMGATADSISEVEIEGQNAYARYIPGRGTIISKDYEIVEAVANAEASDASLQVALGYSAVKPADADISIEARDADNNVVWAEATNEQGEAAARAAAAKQVPAGGRINRQSLKAALEERAKAVRDEQGPQVRNVDDDYFAGDEDSQDRDNDLLDTYGQGYAEVGVAQENNIGAQETYKPRDPNTLYDTTAAARKEFSEAFSDLDMEELGKNLGDDTINFAASSPFATMSDSFMLQAAKAKKDSGANNIFPKLNKDGSWSLMETISPEADLYSFDSRSGTLVDPDISEEIDAEQAREDANKLPPDVDWEVEAQKEIDEIEGAERARNTTALATRVLYDIKGVGKKTIDKILAQIPAGQLLNNAFSDSDGTFVEELSKIRGVSKEKAARLIARLRKTPRNTKAADDFVNGPRREEIRAKWKAKADDRASSSSKRQASRRGSPVTFIKEAITKAKQSRYARQKLVNNNWVNKTDQELVTVNGTAVNLIDLVKEGQRLFSIEQRADFTEGGASTAQRNGLMQVLGSLIEQDYEIRISGYDIRSKLLKDINELSSQISREDKELAAAALEWDLDADDPRIQGRLNELLQALDAATARVTNKDRGTFEVDPKKTDSRLKTRQIIIDADKESRRNAPLDRLKRERKAWAQKYIMYQKAKDSGDTSVEFPKKTPLLAVMDTVAGFENGKPVTLGKILNTAPAAPIPKDSQYVLTNEDGFEVFTGNKQEVQERIESDGQAYRITKRGEVLTDEQFARERNVGFNDRSIVDDLRNENVALQDRIDAASELGSGQFTRESLEADPDYSFDPDQRNVGDLGQIGLKAGTIGKRVADLARRTLRLEKPVSVISIKELLSQDVDSYFDDPKVAQYVKDVAEELRDNPQGGGRYIGFGDAHIILIDPNAGKNELDTAMIVAHELGHALYKEQLSATLQNATLYNRLFDAFQKARDAKDAPTAYKEKYGFEEWYADQTANWAISEYAKERKKGLIGAHFQKVARALVSFYKAFSADMKQRFGKAAYKPEFKGYIDEVLKRRRFAEVNTRSGARAATMQEKVIVRKMAEVIEKQQPYFTGAILKKVQQIIRSDGFSPIYNFIFTADSRLRKIGGNKIADLFYARAQESKGKGLNKLGFLKTAMAEGNTWYNKLEDAVDGKLDSPEVAESIRLAFTSTPTRDLDDANAIAIRGWFDRFYDEYIAPSNTEIGRQRDYAPVVLKLSAIDQNPDGLVKLLLEADPAANEADIRTAVQKLVNYQQAVMDGGPIAIKEADPAQSAEKAIILTKKVKREKLQDAGFLEDPDVALMRYISNMVKRVEWNRNTKDSAGASIYEEELKKLDPKAREEAKKIVYKYLGYQEAPLGPMWRAINSWGAVLQVFAILPLAVLGSIPELAGPVIASKEFSAVAVAMKEIVKTVRNREDARSLARDLGVVTSQSVANVMMSQAELDFMDTRARKITDGFFRVTLLDTYTKFTREFAANMGVRFLENHSNPESAGVFSKRYLKELGVTAEEVQAWSKSNQDFSTTEGKKVREALQRFVESSTLRPNAAERPLWASDPRWALAWQLKGFFYSYGKVMLAGAKREATARLEGASAKEVNTYAALTGAAGVFALMGIATMPLAMVGMELREYAKFGLAWAIPGIDHEAKNYFRTDSMSWQSYLGAAFDRSFAAGPVTIAQQAMQAADWGRGVTGAAAVVAGPTAETIHRIFTDGFDSAFENRILPTGLL